MLKERKNGFFLPLNKKDYFFKREGDIFYENFV